MSAIISFSLWYCKPVCGTGATPAGMDDVHLLCCDVLSVQGNSSCSILSLALNNFPLRQTFFSECTDNNVTGIPARPSKSCSQPEKISLTPLICY